MKVVAVFLTVWSFSNTAQAHLHSLIAGETAEGYVAMKLSRLKYRMSTLSRLSVFV